MTINEDRSKKKNPKSKKASIDDNIVIDDSISLEDFNSIFMREAQKHQNLAGRFVLLDVTTMNETLNSDILNAGQLGNPEWKCVHWGIDPIDGKRICLKWERV